MKNRPNNFLLIICLCLIIIWLSWSSDQLIIINPCHIMLKKYISPSFITIFCFILSSIGIINNLFFHTQSLDVALIKHLFDPLILGWVFMSNVTYAVNGIQYINGFFEILLFIGAILYVTTQHKETRLIKFVMSVIFLCNIRKFYLLYTY